MKPENEVIAQNQETRKPASLEEVYYLIRSLSPEPVNTFVPQDAVEQKNLFLADEIENPSHDYKKLEATSSDRDGQAVRELAQLLSDFSETDSVKYAVYKQYADRNVSIHDLIVAARDTHSLDEAVAMNARKRFMELNIELYGAPDEDTFDALINETKRLIDQKNLSLEATQIRDELFNLLPNTDTQFERSLPSAETVAKMKDITEYLYGGMLAHIPPEKETFSSEEIAEVFRIIINDEFGESAAGWKVTVVKAASIVVSPTEKIIRVPENRDPISNARLRGLVVHELGVHLLRSITGSETDLLVLSTGLSDYYDAEEGLGKVMEQAAQGKYMDSGIPYYQAAGLIYFNGMDFRAAHEVMWRIGLLKKIKNDAIPTESDITEARVAAYKTVFRITRGTDSLPWFKDLAYYNGSSKMWKYCETACDDPELFMFLLMGKSDITNDLHRRAALEASSI